MGIYKLVAIGLGVREVSLIPVSYTHHILVQLYAAPPMRMGVWSMACVLLQWVEYYYYWFRGVIKLLKQSVYHHQQC